MDDEAGELQELCTQAAVEPDLKRLLELVHRINQLLAAKQDGLEGRAAKKPKSRQT